MMVPIPLHEYQLCYCRSGCHSIQYCVSPNLILIIPVSPPTFTLRGDTQGGPPTTYTWTRNGAVITANSSYSISIAVTSDNGLNRQLAGYTSTLVVTGHLPGVYEYTISNRAMTTTRADSISIEGNSRGSD